HIFFTTSSVSGSLFNKSANAFATFSTTVFISFSSGLEPTIRERLTRWPCRITLATSSRLNSLQETTYL
ncbi:unnamed protein product, partial [Haemonchus placei]|uniref:Ovule protein n=1 Tax=Haemonchus placei TaxID=6290 RepID=A0A0N4XB52_HAEPC